MGANSSGVRSVTDPMRSMMDSVARESRLLRFRGRCRRYKAVMKPTRELLAALDQAKIDQADGLDLEYIHDWCERHGTRALLDRIRSETDDG